MNKFLSLLVFIALSSIAYAGYEIDFMIGETKNTRPLKFSMKIQEIDLEGETIISPLPIKDEFDEPIYYSPPKIGDTINPGEYFHFRLLNNSSDLDLENSQSIPSQIIFSVLNEQKEIIDDVILGWKYKNGKINFISSGEKNFVFMPFQRNLPKIDRKTGIYKNTYEISLINSLLGD